MRRLLLVAVLVTACGSYHAPSPTDNLPTGAELIYSNIGGDVPVRTFRIGECVFTETYYNGEWVLENRAFLGTDPAVDCAA